MASREKKISSNKKARGLSMKSRTSGPRPPAEAGVGTLRVGDRVKVKSRQEILATLDSNSSVENTVLMPEMLKFAGQTLPVDAVVHRTCDGNGSTNRDMTGTVHLQGARCDGSAHGDCQARCLLFWRKEWLEPDAPTDFVQQDAPPEDSPSDLIEDVPATVVAATRDAGAADDDVVYSCQATQIRNSTCLTSMRDPGLWLKDVRSGNAVARTAIASFAVPVFNRWQIISRRLPRVLRIRSGETYPWLPVPTGEQRRVPPCHLEPGELIDIKSQKEIESTLNQRNELRGLSFALEMIPYCGKRARVLMCVERIIDEKTGRMLKLRDCIILEGIWCDGTFHGLCGRKIYSYWREAWLRRVEEDPESGSASRRFPARAGR
jgi:hypothetical protein